MCLSVCLCVCVPLYLCMYVCMSDCLPAIQLPFPLEITFFIEPIATYTKIFFINRNLSIYLSIYLSIWVSIYLPNVQHASSQPVSQTQHFALVCSRLEGRNTCKKWCALLDLGCENILR